MNVRPSVPLRFCVKSTCPRRDSLGLLAIVISNAARIPDQLSEVLRFRTMSNGRQNGEQNQRKAAANAPNAVSLRRYLKLSDRSCDAASAPQMTRITSSESPSRFGNAGRVLPCCASILRVGFSRQTFLSNCSTCIRFTSPCLSHFDHHVHRKKTSPRDAREYAMKEDLAFISSARLDKVKILEQQCGIFLWRSSYFTKRKEELFFVLSRAT